MPKLTQKRDTVVFLAETLRRNAGTADVEVESEIRYMESGTSVKFYDNTTITVAPYAPITDPALLSSTGKRMVANLKIAAAQKDIRIFDGNILVDPIHVGKVADGRPYSFKARVLNEAIQREVKTIRELTEDGDETGIPTIRVIQDTTQKVQGIRSIYIVVAPDKGEVVFPEPKDPMPVMATRRKERSPTGVVPAARKPSGLGVGN